MLLYLLFPKLYGERRVQALFRPSVYEVIHPTLWREKESTPDIVRYAMANSLFFFHNRYQIFRFQSDAMILLGPPHYKRQAGGREYWVYKLCNQSVAPARTWLLPGRFSNDGVWALELAFHGDRCTDCKITVIDKHIR